MSSSLTTIEVTRAVITAMDIAASRAFPEEACGLLLGTAGRISQFEVARNVHPQPEKRFEIDPQALIDAHRDARNGGPALLGYFHSHPAGVAAPSAIDAALAAGDGMIWAIMAEGQVRFWHDLPGGFRALSYTISST